MSFTITTLLEKENISVSSHANEPRKLFGFGGELRLFF